MDLPSFQPNSRKAWRAWLQKNHATSSGVWLVIAKKHSGIPSLSYSDAVEEALCFGWIDSLLHPIDDKYFKQVFTPRKPKSKWSPLNRTRAESLIAAGLMAAAGMAMVTLAKKSGTWEVRSDADRELMPSDLQKALNANAAAKKNWPTFSPSMRKGFVRRVTDAKRPETRAARIKDTVAWIAKKVTREEMMVRAGFGKKKGSITKAVGTTKGTKNTKRAKT